LEETGHDPSDKKKALEKALEWGDEIPIGIFYTEARPVLVDEIPHIRDNPILRQKIEETEISATMKKMG
jgi:2-oxoglutarate ferredoxin oxidoreductase subunit beta